MKNIIIGTAGHVDHGKTALIKALTGIETDRIKEEKKRGITIELGFAYLDLPDGEKAGIIDVPGHEKFVKNMLAGAGGIDLALLVVAADEGFMPQTREHLGILSLLNISEGIIVVTKKDMVDEDWLEIVCDEVRQEVQGTFLENAQIIPVSSYTGEGIEQLRQAIFTMIDQKTQIKNLDVPFRIPVDRIFSVEGFGTVITGTLIEGTMKVGDPVTVYPSRIESRIRNLQVHSQDVQEAYAGQRVAVNLAGLKKTDLNKGDVIAVPDSMHTTMMIDIHLTVLKDCDREIRNATRLHLYHGARDILCKIVLLDRDSVGAGESCYAQLRLEEEIAVKTGDRFVLRFYSPVETIGGGVILDSNPFKHKRNDAAVLESLKLKEGGSDREKISAALRDYSARFETLDFLQIQTGIPKEQFDQQINKLIKDKVAFRVSDNVVIHTDYLNRLKDSAVKLLESYHKENPLREGMKKDEFRNKLIKYEDISVVDLAIPATTDGAALANRLTRRPAPVNGTAPMTVVFSSYQSIDAVAQAQELGAPGFDLVICDEAHRTTGATVSGTDESAFVRVHSDDYIHASKRLYMTATPRIYDDSTKARAGQKNAILASMNDVETYGEELFRLGFGEAVSRSLLTDYKVLAPHGLRGPDRRSDAVLPGSGRPAHA